MARTVYGWDPDGNPTVESVPDYSHQLAEFAKMQPLEPLTGAPSLVKMLSKLNEMMKRQNAIIAILQGDG